MEHMKKFEKFDQLNLTDFDKQVIIECLEETFNDKMLNNVEGVGYFLNIFSVMRKLDSEKALDMNSKINDKFNKS